MAINNIEERIERSLFERIRKNLVLEGYLPDIDNSVRYPVDGQNRFTKIAQDNWEADIKTVATTKGFCIELFGSSAIFNKGIKQVPRIVIVPQRVIPGDIGVGPGFIYQPHPQNPEQLVKIVSPLESVNIVIDMHLISNSITQSRVINAVLQRCFSLKTYITFYDNVNERFFIKATNYYEISDVNDGVDEKVYSYEVQDLFLFDINSVSPSGPNLIPVSMINEIGIEIIMGYRLENNVLTKEYPDENINLTIP